jgi:hypothetical protein
MVKFIFEAPDSFLDALTLPENSTIDEETFNSALKFYSTSETLCRPSHGNPDYFALR